MRKSRTICFDEFGPPEKALRLEVREEPDPGDGEALLRIEAAPVNPADLNLVEGHYPVQLSLPAVPGMEGVATIEKLCPDVAGLRVGDRVLPPHGMGTWREFATVPAAGLVRVPPEIPVEQAAMLKINPPTAWRMLHDFVRLEPGEWVVQNAANSSVGRAVIVMAKALGLRTVNVVRREGLDAELFALGANAVLVDGENLAKQISEVTGDAPARLALNAVGGESALNLAKAMAPGGTQVTYGAMGRQPVRVPNGMLIFKRLTFTGFWITEWYRQAPKEEITGMFAAIFPLMAEGRLSVPVAAAYPLEQFATAVRHAAAEKRGGKVLFVNAG